MKNTTKYTGKIVTLERYDTSLNGNPRYKGNKKMTNLKLVPNDAPHFYIHNPFDSQTKQFRWDITVIAFVMTKTGRYSKANYGTYQSASVKRRDGESEHKCLTRAIEFFNQVVFKIKPSHHWSDIYIYSGFIPNESKRIRK